MQVGDLVRFHYDHRWTGLDREWGYGLVEEEYDDGTFEVFWPNMGTTRTAGPKALEVISESR